jgi:hypothetical protein
LVVLLSQSLASLRKPVSRSSIAITIYWQIDTHMYSTTLHRENRQIMGNCVNFLRP